jgi:hypothetical protein
MVSLVPLVESPLPYAMPRRPLYAAPAVEAAFSILETLGNAHEMGVTDLAGARPGHELRLPVVGDPGQARVPGEEPADRPVPAHPPALRRRDVDHRSSVAAALTSSVSSPRLPDQLLSRMVESVRAWHERSHSASAFPPDYSREEVRHSHAGDYRSSPVGSDANVPRKGWGLACGLGGVLSADRDPR